MNQRRARLLFYGAALLLCLYFIRPAFDWFNGKGGAHDWDAQTFYLEAAVRPVLEHGRRPVWNPWYGGGLPQAANPQVKLYSPTWLFALAAGSLAGHKIAVIFYYLLGTWSMMFLLYGVLRLRGWAALCATTLYVFAGSMPLRVLVGHTTFFCILIYPLVVAFFLLCIRSRGVKALLYGSAAAITLSAMYSEGSHAVLIFLPGAGFATVMFTLFRRDGRILFRAALVLLLFAVLSAHRLVPQMDYLLSYGAWSFPDDSSIPLEGFRAIFLDAVSDPAARKWVGQKYLWWEYGTYIGWTSLVVTLPLLVFLRLRRLPLILTLVFLLLLVGGRFSVFSPASLLSYLPFFENLRGWARFTMPALLCWAVLYGLALHRFLIFAEHRFRKRKPGGHFLRVAARLGLAVLLLWSFYDLRIINARHLRNAFPLEIPRGPRAPSLVTIERLPSYGANSAMLPAMRRNLATRAAYEMLKSNSTAIPRSAPGYRGEFHLRRSGRVMRPVREYAHRLEFEITLLQDDTLIMNRNYTPGWRITGGLVLRKENGMMAVDLKAGRNSFAVFYDDAPVELLLWLSALLHLAFLTALGLHVFRRPT